MWGLALNWTAVALAGPAAAPTACTPTPPPTPAPTSTPEAVRFSGDGVELGGELFLPAGPGPFPALLYNHGSAAGMLTSQASAVIGPKFAARGWVFFMPYRRGQGLSQSAGPYILDQVSAARHEGGSRNAAATLTRLLATDHLADQLSALKWLQSQSFVQTTRVAVAGQSFGGVETVLGAAAGTYCAAVDASGGAESWDSAPQLQDLMKSTVQKIDIPVFFFQAENDYNLEPSKQLYAAMQASGKAADIKIYPKYGASAREGHSFSYFGSDVWFDDVFSFVSKHCQP